MPSSNPLRDYMGIQREKQRKREEAARARAARDAARDAASRLPEITETPAPTPAPEPMPAPAPVVPAALAPLTPAPILAPAPASAPAGPAPAAPAVTVPALTLTPAPATSSVKVPLTAVSFGSPVLASDGVASWTPPPSYVFQFSDSFAFRGETGDLEDEPEGQQYDIESTLDSKGMGDTADGVCPENESNSTHEARLSADFEKLCGLESRAEAKFAVMKTESEKAWEEEKAERAKFGMPWLWPWEFWAGERVFQWMFMDIDECGSCTLDRMFVVRTEKWVQLHEIITDAEARL